MIRAIREGYSKYQGHGGMARKCQNSPQVSVWKGRCIMSDGKGVSRGKNVRRETGKSVEFVDAFRKRNATPHSRGACTLSITVFTLQRRSGFIRQRDLSDKDVIQAHRSPDPKGEGGGEEMGQKADHSGHRAEPFLRTRL